MSTTMISEIAHRLAVAEQTRTPIPPPSQTWPELTSDDAYAIQRANTASRVRAGTPIVGHKIGLTSLPMQQMLGVQEPDYGALYADRVARSGVVIDTGMLISPRIEPEIAFVLGRDLDDPAVTAADVLAATAYVVPALEVIDSRIADWRITLVDTIADNASGATAILGSRPSTASTDLRAVEVRLLVDGELVQQGAGDAVLGDPVRAVAWLANALAAHGVPLQAGHVILSGSITAAVPIAPGCHVVADFGPFGTVEATCA